MRARRLHKSPVRAHHYHLLICNVGSLPLVHATACCSCDHRRRWTRPVRNSGSWVLGGAPAVCSSTTIRIATFDRAWQHPRLRIQRLPCDPRGAPRREDEAGALAYAPRRAQGAGEDSARGLVELIESAPPSRAPQPYCFLIISTAKSWADLSVVPTTFRICFPRRSSSDNVPLERVVSYIRRPSTSLIFPSLTD